MNFDVVDEWGESFILDVMRVADEAAASRNLPTPTSCPALTPQLPSTPPPHCQAVDPVKFDGLADVPPGNAGVPFSPPRELSERVSIQRSRPGDGFHSLDSWGGFGNTDSVRKNNREFEALASRNLPTPPSCPARAPQPPSMLPSQVVDLVKFDGSADVALGKSGVPFSPPRELSQSFSTERPRAGDDFGNTDSVRKNNRELERLKREFTRVSTLLKSMENECTELKRDSAKKEEQLKRAFEQIEAKGIEICNLKRVKIEGSTHLTSMNERMHMSNTLPVPPPTASSNGKLKRNMAHFSSNREDSLVGPTPAVLEFRHHTINETTLSTSKSTGVQTEYVQDDNTHNGYSTKSLYEEQLCSNLRATWGFEPANKRTRRELISRVLVSCSEDICAPFDDREAPETGTNETSCSDMGLSSSNTFSPIHALVGKMYNQTTRVQHLVEELLKLCRVQNASVVARSLRILRTMLHHLMSFEAFCNQGENVSVELSPAGNRQGKGNTKENSCVMDLSLLNEDSNSDETIDLPSISWVAIFDAARETVTENLKESFASDALSIMILVVMRSDVNTDRERFGLIPVIECVHQLLSKVVGPFVKKQAVYLLFLIINCPKMLALFCSGDDMDGISEKLEGQSEDVLHHQIGLILRDLGECLSCPLNGSMELKLIRQVIILLAYVASYGKSGFKLLLVPVGPTGLSLLELIAQVLSAQMDLENNKERNLVMREALILLNRLASNPIYSKTTLEVLTRSKSCASLTIDIANRIPRMGRGGPHTSNTHMELEIADLARVFCSRLFSFLGER